jgi:hypothetical protein
VLRGLGQLLLLSVTMLAGCNYDAVPIGAPPEPGPPTEDDKLNEFGSELAGTWRGLATIEAFPFETRETLFILIWMPDTDPPRSGTLIVRCQPGAANCAPTGPGALEFRYSLYEMTDQGSVKGAIELVENGMVTALGTLALAPSGSGLSFFAAGPPPFSFASLSGNNFTKDSQAPAVPDAGASLPGPSP